MNVLLLNPRGIYFSGGFKRISFPMSLMALSSAIKRIRIKTESTDGWSWETIPPTAPDRHQVMLIDAAYEGFGALDRSGDRAEIRGIRQVHVYGLSNQQIANKIQQSNFSPDVIFITAQFTKHLQDVWDMGNLCKQILPGAVVVAGGIAASTFNRRPNELARSPFTDDALIQEEKRGYQDDKVEPFQNGIDIIVRGEGEITAVRLLDTLHEIKERQGNLCNLFSTLDNLKALRRVPNLAFRIKEN